MVTFLFPVFIIFQYKPSYTNNCFVKDYMDLVGDTVVKGELQQLTEEFNARKKMHAHSADFLRQYIDKAWKIVKPCIRDKSGYEEIVWRHNLELNSLS